MAYRGKHDPAIPRVTLKIMGAQEDATNMLLLADRLSDILKLDKPAIMKDLKRDTLGDMILFFSYHFSEYVQLIDGTKP